MESTPLTGGKEPSPARESRIVEPETPAGPRDDQPRAGGRWWLVGLLAALMVFLAGFMPMWLQAERHADERDAARREVKVLKLETLAAAATIDARRGEYEAARQAASQFFTALNTEIDLGPDSALNLSQRDALRALLADRDSLITLLARSDPASAERLAEVYLASRKALRDG